MLSAVLDRLIEALPLVVALIVPALIATVREQVERFIPRRFFPVLLPIVGAVVAGVAQSVGFDVGDFNPSTADLNVWETVVAGAITGLAVTGVHQAQRQIRDGPDPELTVTRGDPPD